MYEERELRKLANSGLPEGWSLSWCLCVLHVQDLQKQKEEKEEGLLDLQKDANEKKSKVDAFALLPFTELNSQRLAA